MSDVDWMTVAFEEALKAEAASEIPVGAVIVSPHHQVIGRGFNRVIKQSDPTAHAEILAIREACAEMQNYRLENTTLYVTLEPCPMCAGAILHARIKRIVFAARDFKTGAAGSMCHLFHPHLGYPAVQVDEGVLQEQCTALMMDFFKARR